MTDSVLPFKIALTKKQAEILAGMQDGYRLEWNQGTRLGDDWYWLRKKAGDVLRISRISSNVVDGLVNKGMIVVDQKQTDWRTRVWVLTERGKAYQIKK